MTDFLPRPDDPDIPFFRYALVVGLLASVSLGIVGSYVVTRRITYIAAAISHCVLGGIGAAFVSAKVAGLELVRSRSTAALAAAPVLGHHHRTGEPLRPATRGHGHQRRVGRGHGHRAGVFRQNARLRRPDELPVRQHPADLRHDVWLVAGMDVVVVRPGAGLLSEAAGPVFRRRVRRAARRAGQALLPVVACA